MYLICNNTTFIKQFFINIVLLLLKHMFSKDSIYVFLTIKSDYTHC